jgi:hypothetical protein
MPGNHGLRLHEDQGVLPAAPGSTQGNPDQAIAGSESGAVLHPRQYRDLLAEGQVLEDQI